MATHPGTQSTVHETKLSFHPPAADAERKMQTELKALTHGEFAFQLLRCEPAGVLAADHDLFRSMRFPGYLSD